MFTSGMNINRTHRSNKTLKNHTSKKAMNVKVPKWTKKEEIHVENVCATLFTQMSIVFSRRFYSEKSLIITAARFFSRRFSSEKCPTITVASFFSSDYNLTLIGSLFLKSKLLKLLPQGQARSAEISAKGSPLSFFTILTQPTKPDETKGSPLSIFFRHCATFFENFFNVSKESPFRVFWYFATEYMLIKPKGSPFYIFWYYATFSERNIQKFQVFFKKKVICAFWALDIASTLDAPVLFLLFRQTIDLIVYVPI